MPDPLVVGRQEAHERHEQQRRVERVRVVVLGEDAALIEAVGQDVGLDLVGRCGPAHSRPVVVPHPGEPRAAICGDPAHDLRRREVLRFAADLPDPAVRLPPVLEGRLDLPRQDRPDTLVEVVAGLRVQVNGVEHRAPHVMLTLVVRTVADAYWPRALVAVEMRHGPFLRHRSAIDCVHDLELLLALRGVGHEVEEVARLPVKAERVQAPQREGRVADPGVAVVPVPDAARRLGQ